MVEHLPSTRRSHVSPEAAAAVAVAGVAATAVVAVVAEVDTGADRTLHIAMNEVCNL